MVQSYRPNTLEEVLEIIANENCHIFAGGTDLMIRKRQWQGAERKFTQPVVFINHLSELKGIKDYDDYYEIGTLTTQTDMVNSHLPEYVRKPYELMSHPAIRNIATVGGNIVNAASVADSLPILIALDCQVVLKSVDGERILSIQDFVLDKYKTVRKQNEILTHVRMPKTSYSHYFYKKLGQRKASILSKVSVFILNNDLDDLRITIGAINPTVIQSRVIEENFLKNHDLDALLQAYKSLMAGQTDKRSTKDYRETVALNMIKEYLEGVMNEL